MARDKRLTKKQAGRQGHRVPPDGPAAFTAARRFSTPEKQGMQEILIAGAEKK